VEDSAARAADGAPAAAVHATQLSPKLTPDAMLALAAPAATDGATQRAAADEKGAKEAAPEAAPSSLEENKVRQQEGISSHLISCDPIAPHLIPNRLS
jgi:hypothetical protein